MRTLGSRASREGWISSVNSVSGESNVNDLNSLAALHTFSCSSCPLHLSSLNYPGLCFMNFGLSLLRLGIRYEIYKKIVISFHNCDIYRCSQFCEQQQKFCVKIVKNSQDTTRQNNNIIFKFRAIDVTMHASGKITFNFVTKASWRLYGIR